MGPEIIEGVEVYQLKNFKDERGAVMHMLRADQPHFLEIKEVYFSKVFHNVVKGWKKHKEIFQSMVVPEGMIRLVIYDDRVGSSTKGIIKTIDFGEENYVLVRLPPGVWYSFKGLTEGHALIANCITAPHDPSESEVLELASNRIPYKWN